MEKDKTIQELEQLVVQNNPEAIYELGNKYFIGKQIQKDYEKAIFYFKKAESLGNIKGKYGLAKCYYYGRGVKQDYEKAYNMFCELIEKNNDIDAKYYIGLMYYWGSFVKKDYKKAFNIFKELYEKTDDKYALMMLPGMYYYGQGTEVDFVKAKQLGELALEISNDKYIAYYLGEIYFYGKGVDKNYEKAKIYFEKSMDDTDDGAYYYLGLIYQNGGEGIAKDEERAKKYFYKVQHDFCTAIIYYMLEVCESKENYFDDLLKLLNYDRDTLIKMIYKLPQYHQSIRYFKKLNALKDEQYNKIVTAVKEKIQKYCRRQIRLTVYMLDFEEEFDILSDVILSSYEYESVESYFEEMCKKNDKRTLYLVGKMCCYGLEFEKNVNLGLEYLKRSANQGYIFAKYELAVISYNCDNFIEVKNYLSNILDLDAEDTYLVILAKELMGRVYYYGGSGVKQDYQKAFEIFSDIQDSSVSSYYLGQMYHFGHGVEKDFEKAYNFYKISAEKNNKNAQLALGLAYLWGDGITQDVDKAIFWLEKSAKCNNSDAQGALGYLYYYGQDEGFNIPINKEYAIELLTKAAENGSKNAQIELEKIKKQPYYNRASDNKGNLETMRDILCYKDNNDKN